jgi:putative FmdB family regulatory protein
VKLSKGAINMTQYSYKCQECHYEYDFEHDMHSDIPKMHICPKCGGTMNRDYSHTAVIIPSYFNESNNPIKYDKTPNRQKRFH